MSEFWPHQFVKIDKEQVIRPEGGTIADIIKIVRMGCVHCHQEYTHGKEAPPPQPCPARNDKREMKRIKR